MPYQETRKSVTFRCRSCSSRADMFQEDEALCRVVCPCGISVDGPDAPLMYRSLIERYQHQEARYLSRGLLADRGIGRAPPRDVANEVSDSDWPFVLVLTDDIEGLD